MAFRKTAICALRNKCRAGVNSYLHFLLSGYRGALARRPMCLLLVCLVALLSLLRLFGISLAAMPPCREASYPDARFRGIVCSREENGTGTVLTLRNTPYGKVKIRAGFGENYSLGTCLLVKGDAERFSRPENPGEFDRELYYIIRCITQSICICHLKNFYIIQDLFSSGFIQFR